MSNGVIVADAAILVLEKTAGGSFCNLKPFAAGANLAARNTARG
jgi:hypothetical protein